MCKYDGVCHLLSAAKFSSIKNTNSLYCVADARKPIERMKKWIYRFETEALKLME